MSYLMNDAEYAEHQSVFSEEAQLFHAEKERQLKELFLTAKALTSQMKIVDFEPLERLLNAVQDSASYFRFQCSKCCDGSIWHDDGSIEECEHCNGKGYIEQE